MTRRLENLSCLASATIEVVETAVSSPYDLEYRFPKPVIDPLPDHVDTQASKACKPRTSRKKTSRLPSKGELEEAQQVTLACLSVLGEPVTIELDSGNLKVLVGEGTFWPALLMQLEVANQGRNRYASSVDLPYPYLWSAFPIPLAFQHAVENDLKALSWFPKDQKATILASVRYAAPCLSSPQGVVNASSTANLSDLADSLHCGPLVEQVACAWVAAIESIAATYANRIYDALPEAVTFQITQDQWGKFTDLLLSSENGESGMHVESLNPWEIIKPILVQMMNLQFRSLE